MTAPFDATVLIRPVHRSDARRIGAILSGFIDDNDWMPRRHTVAEDLGFCCRLIDREEVIVADAGGRVEGFLARSGTTISALYVAAGWQGRGIGRALLEAAKAQAPVLDLWTFQANARAQAFYLREGFAEIARGDGSANAEGLPDIRFIWERTAS